MITRELNSRRNLRQLVWTELRNRYTVSLPIPQLLPASRAQYRFFPVKTGVTITLYYTLFAHAKVELKRCADEKRKQDGDNSSKS